MKITEKLKEDRAGFVENGAINIVIFGDSVSYGAFANGETDYEAAYWTRLRNKIYNIRYDIPINLINSSIGGETAASSVHRMDKQVFNHNPDLLIVSFGLNDVNEPLEKYLNALTKIFERANEEKIDTIFLTPNMLNTYVAKDTAEIHLDYAAKTAEMQNNGKMDKYMTAACELAKSMNITVCDCYSKWKELNKTQDITMLLANRINHPKKEMHELFAQSLFEILFPKQTEKSKEQINTMWENK